MGLFSRRIKNPIEATAQIVACSAHRGEGRWQNCRLQLVVHIDGREPYPAEAHQLAPRNKWPQPGLVVPVDVDPERLDRVKVDFDRMPTSRDRARQMAEQQAQGTGGVGFGAPAGAGSPSGAPSVNIIGDPSSLPPERLAQVESMLGMDLDGDGTIGGEPTSSAGDDDRLGRLERLADLRASGALSDAEFEQEKRRLLGD